MNSASEVVESYRSALGRGDFGAARQLMQDDMTFQGPLDTFTTVLYEMVTNTPAGTAFIAEWYQVRGGKIAALRAVFDARPFAALFGR